MIENRFIALALLAIILAGTAIFLLYSSPLGTLLVLAGVVGYFIFNRKE